jgi:hypothetical protein
MADLKYEAPPTLARFMKSEAFGRIAAGPVGSGKTTSCVLELTRRALLQTAAPDGVRYTRFAVVRQTLKQLKDTVLKDAQSWLSGLGAWKVSEGTFYLNFNDVYSEWVFIPLEDASDQARLLSMQLTGTWLSEAIEMNLDVIGPISGRVGRYPSGKRGTPTWHGMIADTNMPTEMSPWHQFMENLPGDWQKFVQPSGLAPVVLDKLGRQIGGAENLNYLLQTDATMKLPTNHPVRLAQGRKYYERFVQMYGDDHPWVKRYVKAEYGDDPSGLAVFRASFRPNFHIVKETNLIPGYSLIVGQDFGRNPWSLICQVDHQGRLIVHEEVAATNIGLEAHVKEHLRPVLLGEKYFGFRVAVVGDPAGIAKDSISEENSIDVLRRLGLPAFPAPTNDIDPRLRAVEALLAGQTNGGPTLAINGPKCPMLCRAMSGGYRFAKTKQGGLKPKPEKNDPEGFSHVADTLQYVCLVVHGNMMDYIAKRLYQRKKAKGPRVSAAGWT